MRKAQYYIITFSITVFCIISTTAQNDTIKKKKKTTPAFKRVVDAPKTYDGLIISKKAEEKTVSPIFSFNKKEAKPLKGFDYYLNLGGNSKSKAPKRDLSTMSSQSNVDSDVLVKRSFNGKDTSINEIKSNASLGTIESSTKFVRIEFADHGLVDGDRVRIYLNEKIVEKNITLTGISAFIQLQMEPGYNRIDFSALNQGLVGPNTAAFMVYDDQGKLITAKAWNLRTNQNATLGIIRY